jgi:polyisoprenoid-binding protein YceI
MKKILLSLVLSIGTLFAFATKPHIDNVRVNAESSTVKWIGSKVASSHEGKVSISKGVLSIDHGILVGGEIAIDMRTITNTDMEGGRKQKLESHLKNKDFFNVEAFPLAIIKIIGAEKGKGNMYEITANLTIKGIEHPITFEADVNINGVNFLAEARIKIDRTKWGIRYGSGSFFEDLGDKMILDEIAFEIFLLSVK